MAIGIMLLAIGIAVDIFIIIVVDTNNRCIGSPGVLVSPAAENTEREDMRPPAENTPIICFHNNKWERKESKMPFMPGWKLDEDVTGADEVRAAGLLEKYGKIDPMTLADTFILSQSIKEVVEQYATLEFDDYTMDYTRKDLLNGEETENCWKGFYCIGGDGGEISFYVRKSTTDEKIYAFDMEGSSRPEPYASNIRRFIVMRYNDWQATLKLLEEEGKVKQRKRKIKRRKK